MWYHWLKILHVISASVLFGTGLGTAFYMFYVNLKNDIGLIAKATKQVVFADWLFTGTSGVVQTITGFTMIYLQHYSFEDFWVWGSLVGYVIALCCWLPVVWLQIKCRDLAFQALHTKQPLSKTYHLCFRIWWILGIPAFVALLGVYYLMVNKPNIF